MTAEEYLLAACGGRPESAWQERMEPSKLDASRQDILCMSYALTLRNGLPTPDVPPEAACARGCGRPHIPYGPLCHPCEEMARRSYVAAPMGEVIG